MNPKGQSQSTNFLSSNNWDRDCKCNKVINRIPLAPTVRDELLFHTGAPEFVVQKEQL